MDKKPRDALKNAVTECRRLLEGAVQQVLQGKFGIHPDGRVEDEARLTHLSEEDLNNRSQIHIHLKHIEAAGFKPRDAVDQLAREIAFTHLNRLCAFKMMESRGIIRETVSRGAQSQGFMFYLADHPSDEALWNSGKQYLAYEHFLQWLCERLSEEIGVLFSLDDPANCLFPPLRVLEAVLDLINSEELRDAWAQDESLGWTYQYFTPKELRDKSHKESRAPRSSYELAFRNQFYTPSFVVQFLTDNTLGRLWCEMRNGNTALAHECRYLVSRAPSSLDANFQGASESAARIGDSDDTGSSAEIWHSVSRKKKDPRKIKILDPACGSGHFLLYCFDVLETIYLEAYEDPDLAPALKADYQSSRAFRLSIPGLILRYNLHGIDIDPRATQLATLALWLRAHRYFEELGIRNSERPKIIKSNIAIAEPMPGEAELLEQFAENLQPRVLGQLVRVVFDKMKLAGEAGSLLKIEEEIGDVVAGAKALWLREPKYEQADLFPEMRRPKAEQLNLFDVSDITEEAFWEEAEARVVQALKDYADQAANGTAFQRRLFAEDAANGLAFIDLCRQRFDVVLMNPPFGTACKGTESYIDATYPRTKGDLLANFIERATSLCASDGLIGAISNRTCFFLGSFTPLREQILRDETRVAYMADLGEGVLEAAVETAAYVISRGTDKNSASTFFRVLVPRDKGSSLLGLVDSWNSGGIHTDVFVAEVDTFSRIPGSPYVYWVTEDIIDTLMAKPRLEGNFGKVRVGLQTSNDARFLRLVWEVPTDKIASLHVPTNESPAEIALGIRSLLEHGKRWAFYSKVDTASPWFSPLTLVVDWEGNGTAVKDYARSQGDSPSRSVRSEDLYFLPCFSYMARTTRLVPYVVPSGVIPPAVRSQVYPFPGELYRLIGLCASNTASAVARFGGGNFARPVFQASLVQNLPVAEFPSDLASTLGNRVDAEVASRRSIFQGYEPYQEFLRPAFLCDRGEFSAEWNLHSLLGNELEVALAGAFGMSETQLRSLALDLREAVAVRETTSSEAGSNPIGTGEDGEDSLTVAVVDQGPRSQSEGMVSYCVGCVMGRWDIRFALDETIAPKQKGPFDPLPACPPGTLVSPDGLPARPGQIVSEEWLRARSDSEQQVAGKVVGRIAAVGDYPLLVQWNGILMDDPGHPDDIVGRVRDVLALTRQHDHDAVELEVCKTLGVKTLRDYFEKTGQGGFWQDHVKCYSKNRRKAPIYWLLQSVRGSYVLWLYYHRLDDDTLFKALLNYLEPKLRLEESQMEQLGKQRAAAGTGGSLAKQLERQLARQETLLLELEDFRDKLRKVADLRLTPDLNDGVLLNIAPLWELVPWAEARKCWEELLAGKYEWSSISRQLREKGLVKS